MKYRQNNDAVPICAEIHTIREAIGNDSTNIFTENSELERLGGCQRYAALNLNNECDTETKAFTSVPCTGFDKLCPGGTME